MTNQLKNNKYYEFLKVTVSGWIKRLARNEKTEKKLMEKLNMINIDSDEFKSYLATAAYERELQREAELELEKDESWVRIKQQLTEKDQKIEEKDQQLTEKDQEIAELKKQIKKMEANK